MSVPGGYHSRVGAPPSRIGDSDGRVGHRRDQAPKRVGALFNPRPGRVDIGRRSPRARELNLRRSEGSLMVVEVSASESESAPHLLALASPPQRNASLPMDQPLESVPRVLRAVLRAGDRV